MKRLEKFLFSYSILITTVLFVSFGTMSPKPLNFISIAGLLPVCFYFWIRLTSPQNVEADKWSIRFIFALIIFCSLAVFGYHLNTLNQPSSVENVLKNQLAEAQRKNEELTRKIASTNPTPLSAVSKKDAEEESIADLLSQETPAPGSVHRITAKTGVVSIDVYREADSGSKKVGSLEPKVNYPYSEKSYGWYKVVVTSSTSGWVSADQVQEVY